MNTKLSFVFIVRPLFRVLSIHWRPGKVSFWLKSIRDFALFFSRMRKDHGAFQSARIGKDLYNRAKRLALGCKVLPQEGPLRFKTRMGGLPTQFQALERILRGQRVFHKRLALTVLSMYRLMEHKVVPSYSSVFDSSSWREPSGLIEELRRIKLRSRGLKVSYSRNLRATWIGSQGPHGLPSCLSIPYDAFALLEHREVLEAVWALWSKFDSAKPRFMRWLNTLSFFRFACFTEFRAKRAKPVLAKHTFLSEGGGKVRGVTPVNWFIQACLKPFHDYFMEVLRRIPTDCSFDEERGVKWVQEQSRLGKSLHSFDLSDATDRFPRLLLKKVVEEFLGSQIACAWYELMSIPILFGRTKQDIRSFEVGAPMGIYCLWPVFTLCHHAVVQLSARRAGLSGFFRSYVIRGDDIVISSPDVARIYRAIMVKELDLKVSVSKSFDSDVDGPSICEFAKRIFRKGVELSPFSVKQLKAACTFDPFSVIPIAAQLFWILKSGRVKRLTPNLVLPYFLKPRRVRRLTEWLCTPWGDRERGRFPPGLFSLSFGWSGASPKHQRVAAAAALERLRKRMLASLNDLTDALARGMSVTARYPVEMENADNRYIARTFFLESHPYFIRCSELKREIESLTSSVLQSEPSFKDAKIVMALRQLSGFGQSIAPSRRTFRLQTASLFVRDAETVILRTPGRISFRLGYH